MALDPYNVLDAKVGVTPRDYTMPITFKLHSGGMVRDNPSQTMDLRPEGPPPQNPSPQK